MNSDKELYARILAQLASVLDLIVGGKRNSQGFSSILQRIINRPAFLTSWNAGHFLSLPGILKTLGVPIFCWESNFQLDSVEGLLESEYHSNCPESPIIRGSKEKSLSAACSQILQQGKGIPRLLAHGLHIMIEPGGYIEKIFEKYPEITEGKNPKEFWDCKSENSNRAAVKFLVPYDEKSKIYAAPIPEGQYSNRYVHSYSKRYYQANLVETLTTVTNWWALTFEFPTNLGISYYPHRESIFRVHTSDGFTVHYDGRKGAWKVKINITPQNKQNPGAQDYLLFTHIARK